MENSKRFQSNTREYFKLDSKEHDIDWNFVTKQLLDDLIQDFDLEVPMFREELFKIKALDMQAMCNQFTRAQNHCLSFPADVLETIAKHYHVIHSRARYVMFDPETESFIFQLRDLDNPQSTSFKVGKEIIDVEYEIIDHTEKSFPTQTQAKRLNPGEKKD